MRQERTQSGREGGEMRPLAPKQKRFIEEYLVDLNGAAAYRRAGYRSKNADVDAAQLLVKPRIATAIAEAQAKLSQRTEITQDKIVTELAKLGFSNILDYMSVTEEGLAYCDLSRLTHDQAAAIQEFTIDEYVEGKGEDARNVKKVKLKLFDKRQTLVDLGKHIGMFIERKEVSGKDGGPIPIDVSILTPEQRVARIAELEAKRHCH